MKKINNQKKIVSIVFLLMTSFLFAHGSLTKRIKEKTVAIKKHPKNAKLYFDRGFLYEQHEEFHKAIKDYLKSEALGNTNVLLYYRKAQTYYKQKNYDAALKSSSLCLEKDSLDVKFHKLQAQILTQLNKYDKALNHYDFFIENTIDINPDDIIEISEIYLTKESENYQKAIEVIDIGLDKLGKDTFTLQLKKLEYFERSWQFKKAIEQYNYFILSTDRREFWYFKKANYLFENKKTSDAKIAVQQAKAAVLILSDNVKNTAAIKALQNKIDTLEANLSKVN